MNATGVAMLVVYIGLFLGVCLVSGKVGNRWWATALWGFGTLVLPFIGLIGIIVMLVDKKHDLRTI